MGSDLVFFATVLALFALFTGNPGWAFLIFLIGVVGS